jgi:quercetin dioxygenase-like cupin family protein
MAATVARQQGEGRAFWMLGGIYELLVSAEETDGEATVMRMTVAPGTGPPPHTHPGAETVYVLSGTLQYFIGDDKFDGVPGSVFRIPAGVVEHFEATGDTNLQVLVTYTPGGIENFFAEAGEPAQTRELPPPSDTPPDLARIAEIGSRYGMDIQVPG